MRKNKFSKKRAIHAKKGVNLTKKRKLKVSSDFSNILPYIRQLKANKHKDIFNNGELT